MCLDENERRELADAMHTHNGRTIHLAPLYESKILWGRDPRRHRSTLGTFNVHVDVAADATRRYNNPSEMMERCRLPTSEVSRRITLHDNRMSCQSYRGQQRSNMQS
jgi:hypothetical protein